MAIKKSQIYSTLWSACDALRGSMDASQYKDYVLILLFVKYLSDKGDDPKTLFKIPDGCRFSDFVSLKQDKDIGEKINKKLEAIKEANPWFLGKITLPNFNDPAKLGKGKDMVDMLSKLIGVFEDSNLDFSKNRSADDDILGDAYEYLMKNFAAQSGKSKGQFYTPSEVSRTMAAILHLDEFTSAQTSIYDMACGSGSLLLRALAETPNGATIYGQEKDNATASLAILNMLLHGVQVAYIEQGDTLNSPRFTSAGKLETFDVCIANPPFSTKSWLGAAGADDTYGRWTSDLLPPAKCGDYAFLLHLITSMKPETGRGACILPHGVLFRGNAEQTIRTKLVQRGVIEGIIGLPPNIFFGTGIPACIIVLNKKGAVARKGIFFIDAKDGFMKDGAKNRLRQQDMRRIIDTWNARRDVPHYARFVSMDEIEKNDYNLNIPRYIAAVDKEITQDIHAHLFGGLPKHDIDRMQPYWTACPTLRQALFSPLEGTNDYFTLRPSIDALSKTIAEEPSFISQKERYLASIDQWSDKMRPQFNALKTGIAPKQLIAPWGESLKQQVAADKSLVNHYDAYGRLMDYWDETLQDDCYLISRDGWTVTLNHSDKKKPTYEDFSCDLLPVGIVLETYFQSETVAIRDLQEKSEQMKAQLDQMIADRLEQEECSEDDEDEVKSITAEVKKSAKYKAVEKQKKENDKQLKAQIATLTDAVAAKYDSLTESEIKPLVIERKWLATLRQKLESEMEQVGQQMTADITALAERYAQTLPEIDSEVAKLETKVNEYLKQMGF